MRHLAAQLSADLLGGIILCFLLYLLKRNVILTRAKTRQYMQTATLTLLILVLEVISKYLDAFPRPEWRGCTAVLNALGFVCMYALPIVLGMLYSDTVLRWRRLLLLPVLAGAVVTFASVQTGWIFFVDETGLYQRGPLFWVNWVISIYSFAVLIFAHEEMAKAYDSAERAYLWLLYLIVLGCSAAQILNPEIVLIWGGVAVTELLYYVFLRELQFKFDVVTGARNRNNFELALLSVNLNHNLFLIECDVNNLKVVNDTLGHAAGDAYLRETVRIIRESYGRYGHVYRIGGDEFAVIAEKCTEQEMAAEQKKLLELAQETAEHFSVPYYVANAYCQFRPDQHTNVYHCLQETDQKMYLDKKRSKEKAVAQEC